MPKPANLQKQEVWEAHIAAWESSGQTQKDFCSAQGLNFNNFAYWRARFKKGDRPRPVRQVEDKAILANALSSFIPMEFPSLRGGEATVDIMLPQGTRIVCPVSYFLQLVQPMRALGIL